MTVTAERIAHLTLEGSLQQALRQLLEQPALTGQPQTLGLANLSPTPAEAASTADDAASTAITLECG